MGEEECEPSSRQRMSHGPWGLPGVLDGVCPLLGLRVLLWCRPSASSVFVVSIYSRCQKG